MKKLDALAHQPVDFGLAAGGKALEAAASAKTSEENAKESEANAKISEDNSKDSELNAKLFAQNASDSANSILDAEANSAASAEEAKEAAERAKAAADRIEDVETSFQGVLHPKDTVAFEDIPPLSDVNEGGMYNISNEFTTTDEFKEGAGHVIPAGSDIYKSVDGYWNVFTGSLVDSVNGRKGNVVLTILDNENICQIRCIMSERCSKTGIKSGK